MFTLRLDEGIIKENVEEVAEVSLFANVRFFNFILLMQSVPTVLLLNLGRQSSILDGMMGSFEKCEKWNGKKNIMACWNCGLGVCWTEKLC